MQMRYSPLHLAAMGGHSTTVETLVNYQPNTVAAVDRVNYYCPTELLCVTERTVSSHSIGIHHYTLPARVVVLVV